MEAKVFKSSSFSRQTCTCRDAISVFRRLINPADL